MTEPRLADHLRHILDATARVSEYLAGLDEASFLGDHRTQDAVIRNLEIIGEASRRIQVQSPEFVAQHPELPLNAAYQMRNAVAHGYFEVDLEIVWNTGHSDLPPLARQIADVLSELDTRK